MSGCYGSSAEDRYFEAQLDRYLDDQDYEEEQDERYQEEDYEDEY